MWGPVSRALLLEVNAGQPRVTLCTDLRSQTALDWSLLQRHGVITDPVRFSPLVGASFAGAGRITHPDHASARQIAGSSVVLGVFSTRPVSGRLFSCGAEADLKYLFRTNATGLMSVYAGGNCDSVGTNYLNNSVCHGCDWDNGSKPKFYTNGLFQSDSLSNATVADKNSIFVVGNNTSGTSALVSCFIACVFETTPALSSDQHKAVYDEMAVCKWDTQPWIRGVLDV